MKTITIQIGNSDDKLSQAQWALFVQSVQELLGMLCDHMHFSGASDAKARWQNAAWVITADEESAAVIGRELGFIAAEFGQESIAWTEGVTVFIPPAAVEMSPRGQGFMACGHHISCLVHSNEGTHYCAGCEADVPF